MTLHTIMLTNGAIASTTSLLLNSCLVYLIVRHTPAQMRLYSRLMLMHCINDTIFIYVTFIVGPLCLPLRKYVFIFLHGFFVNTDPATTQLLMHLSTWVSMASALLIPIDFIYRYISVRYNRELSTRTILLMAASSYFVAWIYEFPLKWMFWGVLVGPSPESANFTALIREDVPEWAERVPPYVMTHTARASHPLIVNLYSFLMAAFVATSVLYTSVRIQYIIRRRTFMLQSRKVMQVNRQISAILTTQAVLPLIGFIAPIVAIPFCLSNRVIYPMVAFYACFLTDWFTVSKPLVTILVMEQYRTLVFGWLFRCGSGRVEAQESAEVAPNKHALSV